MDNEIADRLADEIVGLRLQVKELCDGFTDRGECEIDNLADVVSDLKESVGDLSLSVDNLNEKIETLEPIMSNR